MTRRDREIIPFMNHLHDLQEFFNEFDVGNFPSLNSNESSNISIYENNDNIFVETAVPGIDPKDINITFEKGLLYIKAETKKEEEKNMKYHLKASRCFSYRIPLPNKIDEQTTPKAEYKDGVLKVIFNKSKASQPQKIKIEHIS